MKTANEIKDRVSKIRNLLIPGFSDQLRNQPYHTRIYFELDVLRWVLCDCGAGDVPDHRHSVECDSQQKLDSTS